MEEGEEEGTAKVKSPELDSGSGGGFKAPTDWRSSISQNRFSSILDSWMRPQSPTNDRPSTPIHEKKVVSEPKLVEQRTGGSTTSNASIEQSNGVDSDAFEQMLVGCLIILHRTPMTMSQDDLGLKGPKRDAMYRLPAEQKRYLLEQNQASRASTMTRSAAANVSKSATTYGPASAASMLPRLVPQLTGDSSIMRRFSIAGWGASASVPTNGSPDSPRASVDLSLNRRDSIVSVKGSPEKHVETPAVQPQATGGLWSSWWTSSGGTIGTQAKETEKTPRWYATGIRNGRTTDTKLVKHLISLRVHISTANLAWIEDFVTAESGMNILSDLLARLVSKGGKRKKLSDVEDMVLLEVIKCLRALLNTEVSPRSLISISPVLMAFVARFS